MPRSETAALRNWPDPSPCQCEVLLLGSYHMDQPGLDVVNVDADDVLADRRQREIRELVDRLESWVHDAVAVERPASRQEAVDALYDEYRSGEPASGGLASVLPQRLFGEALECLTEVEEIDFHHIRPPRLCPY